MAKDKAVNLIEMAKHHVDASLRILRLRATYGTKVKPTVKELNEIVQRLNVASQVLGGIQ